MNIASYFSSYKLQEARIAELKAELSDVKKERDEILNKLLAKVGIAPMFHVEPKPEEPRIPPIIGPSGKKAYLAEKAQSSVPTDEELIERANEAAQKAKANGNHG